MRRQRGRRCPAPSGVGPSPLFERRIFQAGHPEATVQRTLSHARGLGNKLFPTSKGRFSLRPNERTGGPYPGNKGIHHGGKRIAEQSSRLVWRSRPSRLPFVFARTRRTFMLQFSDRPSPVFWCRTQRYLTDNTFWREWAISLTAAKQASWLALPRHDDVQWRGPGPKRCVQRTSDLRVPLENEAYLDRCHE